LDLSNDSGDVRPDPTFICRSFALSSDTERLAREARRDEIHDSTPRVTVEGADQIPYRCLIQDFFFHPGHVNGCAVTLLLDDTYTTVAVPEGKLESEFEAGRPGT
jgi:V8-like Glu-specific endopeptidase